MQDSFSDKIWPIIVCTCQIAYFQGQMSQQYSKNSDFSEDIDVIFRT